MRDALMMTVGATLMLIAAMFILTYWNGGEFETSYKGDRLPVRYLWVEQHSQDGFCWPQIQCEVS